MDSNNSTISTTAIPSQCANDIQMFQRNTPYFYINVVINHFLVVLTGFFTFRAVRLMWKRVFFSKSSRVLIYVGFVIVNVHELIYAYIQTWSALRSILHSNDPCSIMFNEYECFSWYTANIFSRLLILTLNCALTIDRVIALCIPRVPSTYLRGAILSLNALIVSVIVCAHMTSDGPNNNIQSNCFQRLGRNINELKAQIYMYLWVILVCMAFNAFSFWQARKMKRSRFDINERYIRKEAENSSRAISLIVLYQTMGLACYTFGIHFLIEFPGFLGPFYTGIGVLYLYTYPYACVSLPYGVLYTANKITKQRNKAVNELKKTNEDESQTGYFNKLKSGWESDFDSKYATVSVTPID
ncbi:hypothetical protein CRE_09829 [Caenorhabditis remanei]|uniref:Uncharacterized protein n=1 Tax=Caenorhabditis remanei TaxID=31234 RepID=E3NG49_CAERE|nr:hypothetical protein CRE_09829 [Caenorhabditis remanei]